MMEIVENIKEYADELKNKESLLCNKCNDEVRFTPNVTVE